MNRFPEPGLAITVLTYGLLLVRKLVVRFLCLPRVSGVEHLSQPDEQTGRITTRHYMKEPYYVPATFWQRWNPEACITWLAGGLLPGDGGSQMKSEGFLFEDIGPEKVVGKGIEETNDFEKGVKARASADCPYKLATA